MKFPEKKLFIFGLFLSAALFAIFSFLPSVKEMYIAGVFMALGSGLVNPIINGLISKSAPEDIQGSVLGLSSGFGALARVLGPFCGLYLFSYNENATFLLSATVYGLVGLVFLVVLLKKPHQSDLIAK